MNDKLPEDLPIAYAPAMDMLMGFTAHADSHGLGMECLAALCKALKPELTTRELQIAINTALLEWDI